MAAPWHYYFMASLYVLAGILHFIYPAIYMRIMPAWIPSRKGMVYLSGVLEIALGAALFFPRANEPALYGIMILLVLFLPVHTHMLRNEKASMGLPSWVLLLRIPLQGLLIYWCYTYL
ncbi:MAG: hypothetical protein EP302_10130 [Bacteroidetes bacterium]|jgi:uncharacterized membrane protein|nr:MAG: hypothetical protein EP302_10130 [Bacteroidota bacterium]UCE70534.1 MAG: hypothetical protein JSW57_06545 [Flavobacteriaceae bacterium]